MLSTLVMTVIGADRPGLVEQVAACIAGNGGNWLESRMSHLGGQFAGIVRMEVDAAREAGLVEALRGLEASAGLAVVVHAAGASEAPAPVGIGAVLEIVGQDRPGILREVSRVLAARHVNVEELSSERTSAPMTGGTLFRARINVSLPPGESLAAVGADLERIAADLMVDVALRQPA